jgi:hypothetical protein
MSRAKQVSKRKSRACAVPLLGAAGLSLSLASGTSRTTAGRVPQNFRRPTYLLQTTAAALQAGRTPPPAAPQP